LTRDEPTKLQRLQRVAVGVTLTVGLVAIGLVVTGGHARALSLLDPSGAGEGSISVLPSTRVERSQEVLIDGQPTKVQDCWVQQPPARVLDHYRGIAYDQSHPHDIPYLLHEDGRGGGLLVWVDPEQDLRKAVTVEADPRGGTRYRLLETSTSLDPEAGEQRGRLPADLPVPESSQTLFTVREDETRGMALLRAPGDPSSVAEQFVARLRDEGYQIDPIAAEVLGQGAGEDRVAVPFHAAGWGGERQGILVVTRDGVTSRVQLQVR
jgi:hypothetical protein